MYVDATAHRIALTAKLHHLWQAGRPAPLGVWMVTSAATGEVSTADRMRQRLARNRAEAQREVPGPPTISDGDVRIFDRAQVKRGDLRVRPDERERAGRMARRVEESLRERQDEHWRAGAIGETVALGEGRGEQIRVRRDGGAIRELGAGLAYLWSRKRLEADQLKALKRYGELYQAAQPSVKSFLNFEQGDPENSGLPVSNPAAVKLRDARVKGLFGEAAMIEICDRVCGQELKISDLPAARHKEGAHKGEYDDRAGGKLEERIRCAANLLSLYFGLTTSATY